MPKPLDWQALLVDGYEPLKKAQRVFRHLPHDPRCKLCQNPYGGVGGKLVGLMYGTAVAVRRMLASGGGSIVNISSIQGMAAFPSYFAYQAAKAAIIMFSKGVAMDYGPRGIRCNVVCPGTISTPMYYRGLPDDPVRRAHQVKVEESLAPLGRVGTPAEVARAVSFLLSDAASFITRATLVVDGGAMTRCFAYPQDASSA